MLLLFFTFFQFAKNYQDFLNSPGCESIFLNLKRGIIKIDDFKDDPVILWFWRSRTDDAKADSLLKKIALPGIFISPVY